MEHPYGLSSLDSKDRVKVEIRSFEAKFRVEYSLKNEGSEEIESDKQRQ